MISDMAENNPFSVLSRTRTSEGPVRLAVLLPGDREDGLKISLRACQNTSYECIGYDRASGGEKVGIDVDGQLYQIPQALGEALRALRYEDKECYAWADVLIGSSAEELSQQASAMKSMLENSSRLIVWLGLRNSTSTASFDAMQILAHRWQQAALHAEMPPNWAQSRPEQIITARDKLLSFSPEPLQPANAEIWKTMEALWDSPYFKSVRSIPELVMAPEAIVMLGDKTMGWRDFIAASRAFPAAVAALRGESPSEQFMQAFQLINSHETAVWRYRNDDGLELLPMIQSSRDCFSNDPREFVFAMLPITRPSKRMTKLGRKPEKPSADYSKDVQIVFKEAAEYIVLERQDLLLWWSERPPCGRCINGLPSWVPDWSNPHQKTGYMISPNNGMRLWSDSLPLAKVISVDDDFGLHVQAHALDRIENVSPIFTPENCRSLVLSEWERMPSVPGESTRAKADRYWRTLVLDYAGLGESRDKPAKPPSSFFDSWRSLIAEEQILKLLDCTIEELSSNSELQARARNDPKTSQYGPLAGKSQPFDELLRRNALGRRFFSTVSGRTGMTAIETRHVIESTEEAAPVVNFDDALGNNLAQHMLAASQDHVREQDPKVAEALASGIHGELPGQAPPGVRANDLIVACVFGFQPYLLRPETANSVDQDVAGNLEAESTYRYVGSAYVHGIMDGECFKTRSWLGIERLRSDVELVDITIV